MVNVNQQGSAIACCRIGYLPHLDVNIILTIFLSLATSDVNCDGYALWQTFRQNLYSLWWRRKGHGGVSNHQPHGCLLNRLFRRRSKKTSKLRVTALCVGNSPGPVNSPHKGPVTRKMFPFDDVIMFYFSASTNDGVVLRHSLASLVHMTNILIIASDCQYHNT